MNYLRKRGWIVADVEKWIPPRGKMKFGVRKDVWGFGDLLACRLSPPMTALVQTFPLARWKDHVEKILAIPEAKGWSEAGNFILLHGWGFQPKGGVRGAPKVWTLREQRVLA